MYLYYFIKKILSKGDEFDISEVYYKNIVDMTRDIELYQKGGVPDSLDGRYELIVLHSHLFIRRLIKAGQNGKILSQKIIDILFKDFDQSLRELGAGDLSVGKKVQKMIEGYYGRASAYEEALYSDKNDLILALERNLYGTVDPSKEQIKYIVNYINNLNKQLNYTSDKKLLNKFPNIDVQKRL